MPRVKAVSQDPGTAATNYCINDECAQGAYSAITAAGKEIGIYSANGGPEAKAAIEKDGADGIWKCTAAQSPFTVGAKSAEVAYQILEGEDYEKETLISTFAIDASNIPNTQVQTGSRNEIVRIRRDVMGTLLEMKNINKSFGSNKVVEDVNVTLHSGEVLALLGENGAGKSTLIKILGGIYMKDSGQIYVDEQPVEINSIADAESAGDYR